MNLSRRSHVTEAMVDQNEYVVLLFVKLIPQTQAVFYMEVHHWEIPSGIQNPTDALTVLCHSVNY